jgi:uncharacterized protein (DUF1697 family)
MTGWVALLRAVNVSGTGKLPMETLRSMAEELGLAEVRTYIASGNLLFRSGEPEAALRERLEQRLAHYAGKPVPVFLRTAAEMARVCAGNPFPDANGSRHLVYFSHAPFAADLPSQVRGQQGERLSVNGRELHVDYGDGIRHTKLKLPGEKQLTARNINTVKRLAGMLA